MDSHSLVDEVQAIIVSAAREELLPRFARVERTRKRDGSILTEADTAMQTRIAASLQQLSPDVLFLGEEMEADEQAALLESGQPVWCLDPLDGTSNFACGIPYYCVALALLHKGHVELGLVYDPVRDECFSAVHGEGARLDGKPLRVVESGLALRQATALIDFKRLDAGLATRLVTDIPYASQRSFGSVALDWCWLAAGRSHIYLHGRSKVWDYAAGNLIFNEAGGHSVSLDGQPVFTRALSPRASVAAVDRGLFDAWTRWLGIDLQ
ncbi:MAG TPA: inositol monophosphatase family protein [Gammaproteobacteria bacterium]|jgi:myo-inositol-1(or 4)-monophosphatase|nr:inositol monophosphatase family protein [Gammaproteobacteria bacterium]